MGIGQPLCQTGTGRWLDLLCVVSSSLWLYMSQQSVLLTSSIPLVEEGLAHCNEASHPFHPDPPLEQFNLKADNLQQADKTMATTNLPLLDSNPTAPSPISGSPVP
jgi:hypothetical protein